MRDPDHDRSRRRGRGDLDGDVRRHPRARARPDLRDRLHALGVGVRRNHLRRRRGDRRAVARHRARRRPVVRGAARPGRRRPDRPDRRGRPGDDVRLRVQRDAGADAAPDHARPQDRAAAGRRPQVRAAQVPAAGRQGAGDRPVRGGRARAAEAGRDRAAAGLDAARRPRRPGPRSRRTSSSTSSIRSSTRASTTSAASTTTATSST